MTGPAQQLGGQATLLFGLLRAADQDPSDHGDPRPAHAANSLSLLVISLSVASVSA